MARPQEFDRDEVLDKALLVFWQKGYDGASVQDLVDATGLNRGSLYNAFGDKADLFAEVMERYRAASPAKPLAQAAQNPDDDGNALELIAEFLNALVVRAQSDREHKGCLLTNTSAGHYGCTDSMSAWVRDTFDSLQSTLTVLIKRGQDRGHITPAAEADALACFVVAAAQGLNVMARNNASAAHLQAIADQTVRALVPLK